MRINTTTRRRGATLIVTLVVLSALSLMALAGAHRSRIQSRLAGYDYDRAAARELARAGLTVALARLGQSGHDTATHLGQPWHAGLTIDADRDLPAEASRSAGRRMIVVRCIDEQGKLNILKAPPDQLARVLGPDLQAALADWIDADNTPARGGAESSAYAAAGPVPYAAKNQPLQRLWELRLLRGVDDRDYFGEDLNADGQLDANENDAAASVPPDDADGRLRVGLADRLTVYGSGKINVNTATADVLAAVPGLAEPAIRRLIAVRNGPDGQPGTRDDHPFTTLADLRQTGGVSGVEGDLLAAACDVRSEYFRVVSFGSVDAGRTGCVMEMIVHQTKDGPIPIECRELKWQ